MAIKIVRKGTYNQTNDHNNLFNRGMAEQHPIEAITGLSDILDKKYEKPKSGIPKSDLGFDVAEIIDVKNVKAELETEINVVNSKVIEIDIRTTALEDFMNITFPGLGTDIVIPNLTELNMESSFFEEFIALDGDKEFYLSSSYTPGNHSLKVHKNGVLQRLGDDYLETSENTITFLEPLRDADYIVFYSEARTNINSPIHEEYIYKEGENIISLAYRYNLGDNSLSVFHNGVRLNANREYLEKDEYTVKLIEDRFTDGDLLVFRRETHLTSNVVRIDDGSDYTQTTWVYEKVIDVDNIQTITFDQLYIPGSNSLQVFCDGLLLELGSNNDYVEVNEHTIKFNYMIDLHSTIKIVCAAGMYQWYQAYVSTPGQVTFRTHNSFVPNRNDILVYENGLLLCSADDYKEVNYNTIAFIEAPPIGSYIKIYRRR